MRQAALERGVVQAAVVIYLCDGTAWVWEVAKTRFPGVVGGLL